jgi:peroxiredoxin Q/BCP
MLPAVGRAAPEFTLKSDTGVPVSLSGFRGRTVVLYFYPKAGSIGCTEEACAFRDARADFDSRKIAVVGVSPDSVRKIANFRKKERLNFTLLSDPDATVAKRYGLWVPKVLFGHHYFGVARVTYVLDAEGKVRSIIRDETPATQPDAVFSALGIVR